LIAILYREELKEYDFGPGHSFRGDRYETFPRLLQAHLTEGIHYRALEADWVPDEELLRICGQDYVSFTREYYRAANSGKEHSSHFDRFHSVDNRPLGRPGKVEEAARLVIGQAKKPAILFKRRIRKAVCIGGGFTMRKPNWERGSVFTTMWPLPEPIFWRISAGPNPDPGHGRLPETGRRNISMTTRGCCSSISIRPHTIYPGTGFTFQIGEGKGRGYTVNLRCPSAGDQSCQLVFDEAILP
jgi:acetoin utilization protein AcuC